MDFDFITTVSWDGEICTIAWNHHPRDQFDNKKDNGSALLHYQIQRLESKRDWQDIGEV